MFTARAPIEDANLTNHRQQTLIRRIIVRQVEKRSVQRSRGPLDNPYEVRPILYWLQDKPKSVQPVIPRQIRIWSRYSSRPSGAGAATRSAIWMAVGLAFRRIFDSHPFASSVVEPFEVAPDTLPKLDSGSVSKLVLGARHIRDVAVSWPARPLIDQYRGTVSSAVSATI